MNYVQTVAATLLNYTASNATLNYAATNTATGKPTTLNDTINNAATPGLSYYIIHYQFIDDYGFLN